MSTRGQQITGEASIPLWLKLAYGALVSVIVPVYASHYGLGNFLWLSDIALFLTAAAVILESRLLASMPAVGVLVLEIAWMVDFASGGTLLGLAPYMFDETKPLWLRGLSLFHVVLPPTLVWLLYRLGYDPRALRLQIPLTWAAMIAAYLFTDPAENIDWVFGPGTKPQTLLPPLVYLGILMAVWPLCIMAPSHWLLRRLFPARRPASPEARAAPHARSPAYPPARH